MANSNFARLSTELLARKGGAKPAMRAGAGQPSLPDAPDDLGWNDFGAEIIPVKFGNDDAPAPATPRRAAQTGGERTAFTLRLDSDRHLKLKLASAIRQSSAQALVTEALDRFLDQFDDLERLASEVGKTKRTRPEGCE